MATSAKLKQGNCYFNALVVPFRIAGLVDEVGTLDGGKFSAVVVEFAWARGESDSPLELIERSIVEGWISHAETRPMTEVDMRCLRKYQGLPLKLSGVEKSAVEALWAIYGNAGPKYTRGNHGFLRNHLEGCPEKAGHYQPTDECVSDFRKAVDGDYSMLSETVREALKQEEALEAWMSHGNSDGTKT